MENGQLFRPPTRKIFASRAASRRVLKRRRGLTQIDRQLLYNNHIFGLSLCSNEISKQESRRRCNFATTAYLYVNNSHSVYFLDRTFVNVDRPTKHVEFGRERSSWFSRCACLCVCVVTRRTFCHSYNMLVKSHIVSITV